MESIQRPRSVCSPRIHPHPLPPAAHREDDAKWPKKNVVGRQELEVRIGNEHISFETAKIGSLVDVQDSEDPEGLRVMYYLVQDLKVRAVCEAAVQEQQLRMLIAKC